MGQLYVPKNIPTSSYWIIFQRVLIFSKHPIPRHWMAESQHHDPTAVTKKASQHPTDKKLCDPQIQLVPFMLYKKIKQNVSTLMFRH
jgi:hypothetical protein